MARDRLYDQLRDRCIRKQKEQEVYRDSEFSQEFEKWFCRGYEAAMEWVLEQMRELKREERLLASLPKK